MNILIEFLILGLIGALLVGGYHLLKRRMPGNAAYRYGVGIALLAGFLLFWVNGAVGIIGSANNDANMLYLGVLALGLAGAVASGFRPRGMSWTMAAVAVAQVLVPVLAIAASIDITRPEFQQDVAAATLFFAGLWACSAAMFRKAISEAAATDGATGESPHAEHG